MLQTLIGLKEVLFQTNCYYFLTDLKFISNTKEMASRKKKSSKKITMNMSHFSYSHKMRCPLNLVLENWGYLWFY